MHLRLSAALLLPLLLAACGDGPTSAAAAPDDRTRSVVHARGTTEVPVDPRRVVVLDTGELDSAVALGVTPVGAVRAPVDSGLLSYLEPELEGVELVGEIGEPDLERIAALEPDLILGSEVRVADLYDELSAIAPTVFSETVGVAWKENLALHAEALGRQEQAQELLAEYERDAAALGDAVDDATTVSVVRFLPGEIRLYAQDNFIGTVLADAGIARPQAQDVAEFSVDVSPEQVDRAAGDVVLVGTYGDPAETAGPAVLAGPLWARATDGAQVVEVDDDVFFLGTGIGAATRVLDELQEVLA